MEYVINGTVIFLLAVFFFLVSADSKTYKFLLGLKPGHFGFNYWRTYIRYFLKN